jgi:prepilin-type N-terminal cleavage/methylation domain-containing protein
MLSTARKGFTLLELIVVLVILGLLAAVAIPTYNAVINRAAQSTAVQSAEALGRAAVALAAFDRQTAGADGPGTGAHGDYVLAAAEESESTAVRAADAGGNNRWTVTTGTGAHNTACLSIPVTINASVSATPGACA